MSMIEPDKFRLSHPGSGSRPINKRKRLPKHKNGEEFLKGPIPFNWLRKAARLPGKALAVSIAIWFKAGCNRTAIVKSSNTLLGKLGVNRKAGYGGLQRLEKAGLIEVERHAGRSPVVTLLDATDVEDEN